MIPASAQAASSAGASPETPTAPIRALPSALNTGTPPGTPIKWLLYGGEGEPSGKILVVHFGDGLGARLTGRMRPGHLGFSLMRHRADDLDALKARIVDGGFAITLEPTEVDVNGRSERIMLAAGPNEELFEFVEQTP